MSHTFISYAREDINIAERIVQALAENDLNTWVDWKSIPKAEDWKEGIFRGIEEADSFLFLISIDSVTSKVCNEEIDHALKNGKRIIPILIGNTKEGKVYKDAHEITNKFFFQHLEGEINRRNFIFCREDLDDFNKAIEQIKTTIRTDYKWVEFHTNLQLKAIEWENRKESSGLLRGNILREVEERLAIDGQKDPVPTDLQRRYTLESRKATDKQRRTVTGISIAGIVVLATLAVFGFYQAGQANINANESQRQASTAQANLVIAQTAQANEEIQRNLAEQQSAIAIARQLAIQSQLVSKSGDDKNNQEVALLLAAQSMKLFPNVDASNIIRNFTYADELPSFVFNGLINSVAFSPDGKYIVAGGCDQAGGCVQGSSNLVTGKAVVIEAYTGKEISSVTYNGEVRSVAFSPDGKYVILGCDDGTVRVWEANTGTEVSRIEYENDYAGNSVAISPVGNIAASGSSAGKLYIWDYLTNKPIFQIDFEYREISTLAFSPDGRYIAVGQDETASVFEIQSGREISHITHEYSVDSLAFSPGGDYIISGWQDNITIIWRVQDGVQFTRLTNSGNQEIDSITAVAFSPDENYVLTASSDGVARVWSFNSGVSNEISQMTHTYITSAAFSPNGKYVVTGGYDGLARVWETATGTEVAHIVHGNYVQSVAFA